MAGAKAGTLNRLATVAFTFENAFASVIRLKNAFYLPDNLLIYTRLKLFQPQITIFYNSLCFFKRVLSG